MKVFALLSLAIAASACFPSVHTNTTPIDPSLHLARTCPDAVKLYMSPEQVQQSYREVALLNSMGEVKYSDEGEMYASMRDEAAEFGANAIILDRMDEPNAITKVAADVAKTGVLRKGKGMAIYVAADSAHTKATCASYKKPSWLRRHLSF
jgi:glutaredoxin-related protein